MGAVQLNAVEQVQSPAQRLAVLETIFGQVQVAWWKGQQALGEILRDKLWKSAGYVSEEEYLRKRWNVGQREAYHKAKMAKIAESIGEGLPENVRESHLAALVGYPPDLAKEILDTAWQEAPGGKVTAQLVEQVARRLADARKAAIKEEADEARRRLAEDDDEEDGEEGDEGEPEDADDAETGAEAEDEDEPTPDDAPPPTAPRSAASRTIHAAASHPIVVQDEVKKLEKQAERTVRKLERLALSLNCTPQDLLERYGSDGAERGAA